MKLLKFLTLTVCLLTTSFSYATLITDNNYITVDHQGVNIDWAWASNDNVQYTYDDDVLTNELFSPETLGWREATSEEFSFFTANITSNDFRLAGGGYKTASQFFNSNKFNDYDVSVSDFDLGDISSEFREDTVLDFNLGSMPNDYWFDTFYVRTSVLTTPVPKPIPEPLSILLFAVAFIMLQAKLRKNSA
ncbi:hypothetical protein CXF85_06620 [Colwellia sp. 75C3]|uniref:hypothetical protein n=1 Tax=Colwellia sp. 75C3 TaxID=888425 RepID=UPI000C323989|nr:hypothetical protein [Colwellia sp. 75C3]PKG85262.1 hypothetical protein CXF85_06620 [Colwellia sp. 75C3]